MASKVTPSMPGAPSFSSASSYASRSVSILQTWTYSPQKRQDVSVFALTYSLRLRSCKLMDAFVISSLPSRLKETLQSSRVPSLRGRYPTSLLLRTRPPPSRLRSTSRFGRLYDLPCSGDFAPGREGFTNHSMCPCHRAVATTPPRWEMPHRSDFGIPCYLRPPMMGSALGSSIFEATSAFTVVTAR